MLRLKPIRKSPTRRLSRGALRMADGAFWFGCALALVVGAGPAISGLPKLLGLFISDDAIAANASVAAQDVVRMTLPPDAAPPLRGSLHEAETVQPVLPSIAIVIDDLGPDQMHTAQALTLPPKIALAFLPYADDAPRLARNAEHLGHEVLAHVPMQAMRADNAGPMTLRTDLPPQEIARRLAWTLSRVPGFAGINNHEGSKFSADPLALAPMIEMLAARHVYFFDSRTTPESRIVSLSRANGVASAGRDVFLDNVVTIDAVEAQLRALETRARKQGVAIAIGHPHAITLDAVAYWAVHHPGFVLVPLGEAIRLKTQWEHKSLLRLAGG